MTDAPAATPLEQLIARLSVAAEEAVRAGNLDQARATAEDVQLVDPDNVRASAIIAEVNRRERSPGEERALMTILFSDLVDSTMLAGRLEPEAIRDIYRLYREAAQQAVDRFGGFVLQYLGDGIVATFGYPIAHEDDARRAVHAGLALITGLEASAEAARQRYQIEPKARVGIHTGPVVVSGLAVQDARERGSIVGVAPNLAARLQSEAEPGTVVVSDVTQALVRNHFSVRSIGLRQLKGIDRGVEVFVVDGVRSVGGRLDATRASSAGLHGRDEARQRLVDAWEVVGDDPDRGRMAVISGEAGIGKTRLAAEIRDLAAQDGHEVVAGACQQYYSNIPLWPVSAMIERTLGLADEPDYVQLAGLVENLTAIGMDLERSVPLLAPLIGIHDTPGYAPPTLDATTRLHETLEALVDWVAHLAGDTRRLVLVEDVHWADPTTLALLGNLAAAPPRGFLGVVTTREESALPWRRDAIRVPLGRLEEAVAGEIVDDLVGETDLPEPVKRSIIERAEGIPLFVEELTCSVLDQSAVSDEHLPYRLQELMTGRLKTPAIDLRLAQVAATIGTEFSHDVVAEVIGPDYDLGPALEAMETAGIVIPTAPGGPKSYRFRHALMRDAAYETQVLEVRRATHAAIADVLEAEGEGPTLLAHHLDLAEEPVRAVPQFFAAAQQAQERGAHVEATQLLTRAIELIETFPESPERDYSELTARMLRGLNVSSVQGYASADVAADHRRAEVLTGRLGAHPAVVPSLIGIWAYWLSSGDHDTAARVLGSVERLIEDPTLAIYRPEVLACAGFQAMYYGALDDAAEAFEVAMAGFAERTEEDAQHVFWPLPNESIAATAIGRATVAALQGDTETSADWEARAYRRIDELGLERGPFTRGFVNVYASFIRRIIGDDPASRRLGADTVAVGKEYGYAYWEMMGSMYQMGPDPEAPSDPVFFAATIDALRGIGHYAFLGSALVALAELRALAGDLEGALDTIDDALLTVDKTGEKLHLPEILRRRVWHRRQLVGPGPSDVNELVEAYELSVAKDIHVIALRAAIDIARLPDDERPASSRDMLETARGRIPAASSAPEAAEADAILAG